MNVIAKLLFTNHAHTTQRLCWFLHCLASLLLPLHSMSICPISSLAFQPVLCCFVCCLPINPYRLSCLNWLSNFGLCLNYSLLTILWVVSEKWVFQDPKTPEKIKSCTVVSKLIVPSILLGNTLIFLWWNTCYLFQTTSLKPFHFKSMTLCSAL